MLRHSTLKSEKSAIWGNSENLFMSLAGHGPERPQRKMGYSSTIFEHLLHYFSHFRALCIYIFVHTGIFGGINDLGDGEHNFFLMTIYSIFFLIKKKTWFWFFTRHFAR